MSNLQSPTRGELEEAYRNLRSDLYPKIDAVCHGYIIFSGTVFCKEEAYSIGCAVPVNNKLFHGNEMIYDLKPNEGIPYAVFHKKMDIIIYPED